jgi:hypothetical protein
MFSNIELYYVLGPAIIIAGIVLVTFNKRIKKQGGSELSKAIERFKITSIVWGYFTPLIIYASINICIANIWLSQKLVNNQE